MPETPDPHATLLAAARAVADHQWAAEGMPLVPRDLMADVLALAFAVRAAESAPPVPCPGCAALRGALAGMAARVRQSGARGAQDISAAWLAGELDALAACESAPLPCGCPGCARLREALRPFADVARLLRLQARDELELYTRETTDSSATITVGDCRRAAEALAEGESREHA